MGHRGNKNRYIPTKEDRELVLTLRENGDSIGTIARKLGIARNTCAKHFHAELDMGNEEVEGKLTKVLMANATQRDNIGASNQAVRLLYDYFLQKSPTQKIEVSNPNATDDGFAAWMNGLSEGEQDAAFKAMSDTAGKTKH